MMRYRGPEDGYVVGIFGANNNNKKILEKFLRRKFKDSDQVSFIIGDTATQNDLSTCTHLYTTDLSSLDILKNDPVMYNNIVKAYNVKNNWYNGGLIGIELKHGNWGWFGLCV